MDLDLAADGRRMAGIRANGESGGLAGELLHAIFAKEMEAEADGLDDGLGRVSFGDGYQLDLAARAVGGAAGCGDPVFHAGQILGQDAAPAHGRPPRMMLTGLPITALTSVSNYPAWRGSGADLRQ